MLNVKRRILLGSLLTLVGATATAGWWVIHNHDQPDTLVLYGNVDIREVNLAFRHPGRLVKMSFDEGDTVKAGDTLAEIDAQPYRDTLAEAEAKVQAARAELEKLHHGTRPQAIAEAEESVRRDQAVLRNAQKVFKRQAALVVTGSTSQRLVDAARSERDQARANLAAAKQVLALKKEGPRHEDIVAAEARLAEAIASAALARTALADTQLISPANATVLSRLREPGSMVNSSTAVYTLSLRDPVYVRAYVSEKNLGRIAPGDKVKVLTDSSSKVYKGQIGFISPRAEFTPKSVETPTLRTDLVYRLRVVIAKADSGLRQGMPVTVRVNANTSTHP